MKWDTMPTRSDHKAGGSHVEEGQADEHAREARKDDHLQYAPGATTSHPPLQTRTGLAQRLSVSDIREKIVPGEYKLRWRAKNAPVLPAR